jgi:hypothetical protein
MAGVDFGQAPRYGSQGFQEWVDAYIVSQEGEDKILSFLADRLGTSEAAIEEVQRLAREAIHILDDPLFEKHLMPPKEMKGLAKMLKKRRFDMMKGKSPQSILQEIFCKKPEDHLSPKRKKKIMASVEEYASALGPERTWQKLRTQIALCLLQREVSEKDPFLIEYVTRPAFRFYQDHYAER